MPGVYVFPGGRVDPEDTLASGFAEALPRQPPGLDWPSRHKLAVLARAALRETFEETGLLAATTGRPARCPPGTPLWQAYQGAGLAPAFGRLRLFARAVTPPISPIRFDTRFFLAVDCPLSGTLTGNGELEDLGWRTIADAARLPLATITGLVLAECLAHARTAPPRRRTASFLYWMRPKTGRRFRQLVKPAEGGTSVDSKPA